MSNRIVHFEVVGRDGEALRSFFGDLFGWGFNVQRPMDYGLVDPADAGIGGGIGSGPPGEPGHAIFYVEVEDVEAALARAEELGGRRVFGPMEVPGGPTIGQLTDPEGHLFGVVGAQAT